MANERDFSDSPNVSRGAAQERELLDKLLGTLFKVVSEIPTSTEKQASDALVRARQLTAGASLRAAAISGTLALAPGPVGWLTIIPDLAAIWRLQAQLVADIGAVFGKEVRLTEESMIYCLFRHATAHAVRDLVTRVCERVLVQRASLSMTEHVLENIGIKIVQRAARGGICRLLPIIGALGVAGYAYYDTDQVGHTAIEFFTNDIELK